MKICTYHIGCNYIFIYFPMQYINSSLGNYLCSHVLICLFKYPKMKFDNIRVAWSPLPQLLSLDMYPIFNT